MPTSDWFSSRARQAERAARAEGGEKAERYENLISYETERLKVAEVGEKPTVEITNKDGSVSTLDRLPTHDEIMGGAARIVTKSGTVNAAQVKNTEEVFQPTTFDMPTVALTGDPGSGHIYQAGSSYLGAGSELRPLGSSALVTGEAGNLEGRTSAAARAQAAAKPQAKLAMIQIPQPNEWDYKTAQFGPRGEDLPEGAQQWTPDGKPYFGSGLVGKLKGYWWNYTKDMAGAAGVDEMARLYNEAQTEWQGQPGRQGTRFDAGSQAGKQFLSNVWEAFKGGPKSEEADTLLQPLLEKGQDEEGKFDIKKLTPEERKQYNELRQASSTAPSGLSGVVRGANIAVAAGLDFANAFAYATKQSFGAMRGISEELEKQRGVYDEEEQRRLDELQSQYNEQVRNYREEIFKGEINPSIITPSEQWQLAKNTFRTFINTTPIGVAYNALALAVSGKELDVQATTNAALRGWDSGKIMYTQSMDPMIRYEYERRLDAGENPDLLALELKNPWAEMVGEIIFDPLNVIGMGTKAEKGIQVIENAKDATRALSKTMAGMDDVMEVAARVATDEDAALTMRKIAEEYVEGTKRRIKIRDQKYNPAALLASSNENRMMRDMGNFIQTTVSSAMKDGRSADDIAEMFKYGIMSVSDDVDEAQEGITALLNASVPKQWFSELGNDTLTTIRKMITNSDGVVDGGVLQRAIDTPIQSKLSLARAAEEAGKATTEQTKLIKKFDAALSAVADGTASKKQIELVTEAQAVTEGPLQALLKVAEDAAGLRYATVGEMAQASAAAKQAAKEGKTVSQRVQQLADAYDNVPSPVKFINNAFKGPEQVKGAINSGLGTFYFTLNPGTSVRNFISNAEFMVVDHGFDVLLKSPGMVQDMFLKHLGNTYEVGATFGSQAGKIAEKVPLMQKIEAANALQVLGYRYQDTFTKMMDVGLPFDELKATGMTDSQFRIFKELVMQEGHLTDANKAFMELMGAGGDWRTLEFLDPKHIKGLKQMGSTWDELLDLAKNPDTTLEEVTKWIDGKQADITKKAKQALDDVPGFEPGGWESDELARLMEDGIISPADRIKMGEYLKNARQAKNWYDQALTGAMRDLGRKRPAQAFRIQDEYIKLNQATNRLEGMQFGYLDEMWKKIRAAKDDPKQLARTWKELGLVEEMPADIKEGIDALYDWGRLKRAGIHEGRYKSFFEKSENLIKALEDAGADVNDLTNQFGRARALSERAEQVRSAVFLENGKGFAAAPPKGTRLGKMDSDSLTALLKELGWTRERKGLLNAVNKDLGKSYKSWKDIPWDEAAEALGKRLDLTPEQLMPTYPLGSHPTFGRQALETQKGFSETLEFLRNSVTEYWGKVTNADPQLERTLAEYAEKYGNRISEAQSVSLRAAEKWRDFTLLGYGTDKTYAHLAASYIMPYVFWYSGTYKNLLERMVTNPEVVAAYAKYKHAMEREHAMLPEWYRQQVRVDNILGMELDHPLFFNLEQTLFPLYGLTGPDFNDRSKRVDWLSATVDDMGKFGPSIWAPLQWGMAAYYSFQGDKDAALRWGGRMLPQSAGIKALLNKITGNPIEVDPVTLMLGGDHPFDFTGAMDAYERSRVGRALGDVEQEKINAILNDQTMTSQQKERAIAEVKAQFMDVARLQDGPEWQEAYRRATELRSWGNITSPLLGVGFKGRTEVDLQIDEMYTRMNMLIGMRDGMTSDDYQKGWEQLRADFPYMDAVLLSRKGGELRDSAYSYNVLSRLPPGTSYDLFEEFNAGDLSRKFYDSKGDMSGWTEAEKNRWMSVVLDVGSLLSIPSDATKQEWTKAKDEYQNISEVISRRYGSDIDLKISQYYEERKKSYEAGQAYIEKHPEVKDAMDYKTATIANSNTLYKYYGGFENVYYYYDNQQREYFTKKYGDDIFDIAARYSEIGKLGPEGWGQLTETEMKSEKGRLIQELQSMPSQAGNKNRWVDLTGTGHWEKSQGRWHYVPGDLGFWDEWYNEDRRAAVGEEFTRIWEKLPDHPTPELRTEPTGDAQQAAVQALSPQGPRPEDAWKMASPELKNLMADYWMEGKDIPDVADYELTRIEKELDVSRGVLLQMLGTQVYAP